MKCPNCGRETPDYQEQCIFCSARLANPKILKTDEKKGNSYRPVVVFFAALVIVMVLLILNPFEKKPADGTQTAAADSTQGSSAESEIVDAENSFAKDGKKTDANTDSGETAESDQTTVEETVEEQHQPEPETVVVYNAATVLDEDYLQKVMKSAGSGVNYSVCVADLSTGNYTGVNPEDEVSASAMVNIPILYTAASMIDEGKMSLSTGITFRYSVGGRGNLKKSDDGRKFSLEELLKVMLQYSDNNATNTLLDYFGMNRIEEVCHNNGFRSVSLGGRIMETKDNTSNDNYVSAKDLCGMIYHIYQNNYDSVNRDFLYQNLKLRDETADAGLCRSIRGKYYNLNGVKEYKYNEIAVVDNGKTPYVIAYLANDAKMENLEAVASTLGEYVSQRVDSIE